MPFRLGMDGGAQHGDTVGTDSGDRGAFTTLCSLIYLDACIFTPNTRAGVMAHKLDDAKVIFHDKIKYPYDQFDHGLKLAVPAVQDSADTLTFGNNSSIRISTSMRSGTLRYLHVAEFGKICAQYPDKAREIVTGALNTVEAGQFIVIESTAEGQEGAFYRMCQEARSLAAMGKPLSALDWKSHFCAWWQDRAYTLDPRGIAIGEEHRRYFEGLEAAGIELTAGQKAWYVKKDRTLEGESAGRMRRHPTKPSSRRWKGRTSRTSWPPQPSRAALAASRLIRGHS